jgi:hypothetical protein
MLAMISYPDAAGTPFRRTRPLYVAGITGAQVSPGSTVPVPGVGVPVMAGVGVPVTPGVGDGVGVAVAVPLGVGPADPEISTSSSLVKSWPG